MDTKKLIGTIIGVTLFAVLIAGATFAWLTFGTTVGNNTYNGTTMNFLVDYAKGTAIGTGGTYTTLPMLDSNLATPEQAAMLSVSATKHTGSTEGHLQIKLTTTSSTSLTTKGIVRWAICRGTPCTGSFTNALNTGKVSAAGTLTLLNDAAIEGSSCSISTKTATGCSALATTTGSSSTANLISTTATNYYVYFWFDGATISNDEKNQTYSGYIHASATQLQN